MSASYFGHKKTYRWRKASKHYNFGISEGAPPVRYKPRYNKSGDFGGYGKTITLNPSEYQRVPPSYTPTRQQVAQWRKMSGMTGKIARYARKMLRLFGLFGRTLDMALQLGELYNQFYITDVNPHAASLLQNGWVECWDCGARPLTFIKGSTLNGCASGVYVCLAGQTYGDTNDHALFTGTLDRLWYGPATAWDVTGHPIRMRLSQMWANTGPHNQTIEHKPVLAPLPALDPYVGWRNGLAPDPAVWSQTGTQTKPKRGPVRYSKPQKIGVKEKKAVLKDPWIADLYGLLTEIGDITQCAMKAMKFGSPGWRAAKDARGLHERVYTIFRYAKDMDLNQFVMCLLINNVEDWAIGKLSQLANRAVINTGYYRSPVGIGRGGFSVRMK